ncbi:MAG: hypothetical protein ABMA13_13005 [Chthoniobacteraceae bacterium]
MKIAPIALLPLLLLAACTRAKVHRHTDGRFQKVPAKKVERVSEDEARQRANVKLATIDMRTRSPFAADLPALARKRTGKLGGNAYVVTGGSSQTIVTGGFLSLFGDKTSSTLNIEALRWNEQPTPPAKPGATAPAPAAAAPAKPARTRSWWRPWTWRKPAPEAPSPAPAPAPKPKRSAATPAPAAPAADTEKPAKAKAWWRPWSWF